MNKHPHRVRPGLQEQQSLQCLPKPQKEANRTAEPDHRQGAVPQSAGKGRCRGFLSPVPALAQLVIDLGSQIHQKGCQQGSQDLNSQQQQAQHWIPQHTAHRPNEKGGSGVAAPAGDPNGFLSVHGPFPVQARKRLGPQGEAPQKAHRPGDEADRNQKPIFQLGGQSHAD